VNEVGAGAVIFKMRAPEGADPAPFSVSAMVELCGPTCEPMTLEELRAAVARTAAGVREKAPAEAREELERMLAGSRLDETTLGGLGVVRQRLEAPDGVAINYHVASAEVSVMASAFAGFLADPATDAERERALEVALRDVTTRILQAAAPAPGPTVPATPPSRFRP